MFIFSIGKIKEGVIAFNYPEKYHAAHKNQDAMPTRDMAPILYELFHMAVTVPVN